MNKLNELVQNLLCADCENDDMLSHSTFHEDENNEVCDGVVWCTMCLAWYPIENGLLEFLPKELGYQDDRIQFWEKNQDSMERIGLSPYVKLSDSSVSQQIHQQEHFDWYADNGTQSYTEYSESPFWKASDEIVMSKWKKLIRPGSNVLEIGCAQGRCSFEFINNDNKFVGFDISKKLVRQAIERSKIEKVDSRCIFFAADGSKLPFRKNTFDCVLIYGVLHHLPNPRKTCSELECVLKDEGVYFGQENNKTPFRIVFDLLQKIFPLWHEEAGPEFMISPKTFEEGFSEKVIIKTRTHVFLPPHLVNVLKSTKTAKILLNLTDIIFRSVPFLGKCGGIILVEVRKNKMGNIQ